MAGSAHKRSIGRICNTNDSRCTCSNCKGEHCSAFERIQSCLQFGRIHSFDTATNSTANITGNFTASLSR